MRKKLNNAIAVIILVPLSLSAYSEIYQCEENGKLTFQQIPCPVETTDAGCDENYDYSDNVNSIDSSFDDKYCYYRQLDREEKHEKERLMQAYQERRNEILVEAKRKVLGKQSDSMGIGIANNGE